MLDVSYLDDAGHAQGLIASSERARNQRRAAFNTTKRLADIIGSLLLLPMLVLACIAIAVLNPFFNKGHLFYVQPRMGRDCVRFRAIKFRSMTDAPQIKRNAHDPLETDRITPLGRFLRKSRVDELPQVINVLRGEMSLIGPRPDYYDHAVEYLQLVPGYRERHAIRPGISGLAQTELGYVEGVDATRRKVSADLYYITHLGWRLEAWIFWRTLCTVAGRHGA